MARLALCVLAIVASSASVRSQTVLYEVSGGAPGAYFGLSGARIGDSDGDGTPDFLIGAPFDGNDFGAVRLYSAAQGKLLRVLLGESFDAQFGIAVGSAGDVNGDGLDEVIVGSPSFDDWYHNNLGRAEVFSATTGARLFRIDGALADEELGRAVGTAGDLDGDGRADFMVGAPYYPQYGPGSVFVYSGRTGDLIRAFVGDAAFQRFGYSTAVAGDLDLDGFLELIVSAPADDQAAEDAGKAAVISSIDGRWLFHFEGEASWVHLGVSVNGAGDVNGDGVGDVIVAADGINYAGYAQTFSGKDGALLYDLRWGGSWNHVGWSSGSAGDLNDDGFGDIILGASGDDRGYDGHLGGCGSAKVFSGKDRAPLFVIRGQEQYQQLGKTVLGLGDVNADRHEDLLVTSLGTQTATVLSGSCDAALDTYGAGWPGTDGVPSLASRGEPLFCSTILLDVSNSLAATTMSVLFGGLSEAYLPTAWDAPLLVLPQHVYSFILPASGVALPFTVPCDSRLCGTNAYFQVLELDPGASKGVSFTNALKLSLGI
jgi:hypothetical protein